MTNTEIEREAQRLFDIVHRGTQFTWSGLDKHSNSRNAFIKMAKTGDCGHLTDLIKKG